MGSSFSVALELLKKQHKVYRSSWHKANETVIGLVSPANNSFITETLLYMEQSLIAGKQVRFQWLPSIEDLLANDWEPKIETKQSNIIERVWKFIVRWEGSEYTDNKYDAGGPTKYGITLNYDKEYIPDKNGDGKVDAEDVKLLTEDEAMQIFTKVYWDKCKCNELPDAVAFEYADMAFNIGIYGATRLLQECFNELYEAGLIVDGIIGEKTINAAHNVDEKKLIKCLYDKRIVYYKSRPTYHVFGRGWTNRAEDCYTEAMKVIENGTK